MKLASTAQKNTVFLHILLASFHSYIAGYEIIDNDTKPPSYMYFPWLVISSENTSKYQYNETNLVGY